MLSKRILISAALVSILVGMLGVLIFTQQRIARCSPVPLLAAELLPNHNFARPGEVEGMPAGWSRAAGGVQLRGPAVDGEGFDLDGDGRALQLIGIANAVQTPITPVEPGQRYCFSGFALTDSPLGSPTRARLVFEWHNAAGTPTAEAATIWQPVRLWTPDLRGWSALQGSFVAPPDARNLRVRIEAASDDRLYLDLMHLQRGGEDLADLAAAEPPIPQIAAWPNDRRAAVAFTFDWETTMGGLIHSRSLGDPNADQDPLARGLRMREGVTTTMQIFARYDVRATYFATGYNFLLGNVEQRQFMNNPTFTWATPENGWLAERWRDTPWFADDPYSTVQSDPAWYFGDLVPILRGAGHEIQSHTFSHFFGGYVDAATWQSDLTTWNQVAGEANVPPAQALAFPWSSSAGMSERSWDALEQAGMSAVTRLSDQAQYNLFPLDEQGLVQESRCRWLPGREGRMLACPDFYLQPELTDLALAQIERAVEQGGMIDIWAHTEEVISPAQRAAWERVVQAAATNPAVWVAPFSEIAAWQRAVAQVQIEALGAGRYRLHNPSDLALPGLTLQLGDQRVQVDLGAGEMLEVGT
ncbi:polysaccharide deacetylase [Oscillochloris trichoides DG-6]|uniref:Polysaccharide deacetylase n=1 Tax=Oscillochloris trichoides DG-6 TaxID=765420 RepID=E1IBZ7_9CHLR|nr:polysaccharide deacetylase family protein [Oscillochloris trichoides]EFO81259.1 polysaccharide deacetylase [Oscillochloris trichoides DG-6]